MIILFKIQELKKNNIRLNFKWLIILCVVSPLNLLADFNYEVDRGDSLYSLSRKYKVPVEAIKEKNNLSSDNIWIGQKLVIPSSKTSVSNNNKTSNNTRIVSDSVYMLKEGDTFDSISEKYNLKKEEIIAWNNLKSTTLREGQKITLQEPDFIRYYEVGKGDSLYSLSKKFNISTKDILRFNYLDDENLKIGQKLFLKKSPGNINFHYVKKGETLGRIAYLYRISAKDLVSLNGKKATDLKSGSLLEVSPISLAHIEAPDSKKKTSLKSGFELNNFVLYRVEVGETLYSIARQYGVLIEDLKSWNSLRGNNITHNQELKIYNKGSELAFSSSSSSKVSLQNKNTKNTTDAKSKVKVIANTVSAKSKKTNLGSLDFTTKKYDFSNSSLVVLDPKIPIFEMNGDFYYWYKPKKSNQPSEVYSENWQSPLNSYKKAKELFSEFKKLVEARPLKSNALKNKLIIIDPGHGGLDPGAIVKSKDGLGNEIFVVEDEYVYDIALRIYVYLKEHKANVEFTIVAPDHLIRDSVSAKNTFVNVKNEVYNDYILNKNDTVASWINGNQEGLNKRVIVSNNFFISYKNLKVDDILFISLHADNSVGAPKGIGIYYQAENDNNFDVHSKNMAVKISKNIKKNSYIKGQNLYVLRNNNIKTKFLVEVRNLAFQEEAWSIRALDLRDQDAKIISDAILKFFQK